MDSMNNIGPCGGVEILHSISMNDTYEGPDRKRFRYVITINIRSNHPPFLGMFANSVS